MARHLNPQGREPLLLARDTVVLRTWMESPLVFFSCFLTAWLSRDCMTEQSNESLGILSRISGGGSSGDHVRRELKKVFSEWGALTAKLCVHASDHRLWSAQTSTQISGCLLGGTTHKPDQRGFGNQTDIGTTVTEGG